MLEKLVETYFSLVQLSALIVASGLLIIGIGRDVFEAERDPTPGVPADSVRYKLRNDPAQMARYNLIDLSMWLRLTLGGVALLIVFLFITEGVIALCRMWGKYAVYAGTGQCTPPIFGQLLCDAALVAERFGRFIESWRQEIIAFPVGILRIVLIILGPFIIYRLARAVYDGLRARQVYVEQR